MSRPKKKHEKMRDKIDFKKIIHNGSLIGVLNFNLMIPVEMHRYNELIQKSANMIIWTQEEKRNFLLKN